MTKAIQKISMKNVHNHLKIRPCYVEKEFGSQSQRSLEQLSHDVISPGLLPYLDMETSSNDDGGSRYGLIHQVFSDNSVPAVTDLRNIPKDVNPKDVWLSDGNLLVLKGGTSSTEPGFDNPWPMIDNYIAPYRKPVLLNVNDPLALAGIKNVQGSPRFKIFKPQQSTQEVRQFRQPKEDNTWINPSPSVSFSNNQHFRPLTPNWTITNRPLAGVQKRKSEPLITASQIQEQRLKIKNVQYNNKPRQQRNNMLRSIFQLLT